MDSDAHIRAMAWLDNAVFTILL